MKAELTTKEANGYQLVFNEGQKRNEIAKALPKGLSLDKFQKTVWLACKKNPKIMDCTADSIFLAIVEAATKGLDPSISNSCFFIPRKNKGVLELTMQVGYRTIINWIMNTDQIRDVNVFVVYEGEEFEIVGGTNPGINHRINPNAEKTWKNIRFVYGVATTVKGGKIWRYLDKADIEKRRAKAMTKVIWEEWPVEMTLKTGLIYLSKYLPMNTEMTNRLDKEEADLAGTQHESAADITIEKVKITTAEDQADKILGPE